VLAVSAPLGSRATPENGRHLLVHFDRTVHPVKIRLRPGSTAVINVNDRDLARMPQVLHPYETWRGSVWGVIRRPAASGVVVVELLVVANALNTSLLERLISGESDLGLSFHTNALELVAWDA